MNSLIKYIFLGSSPISVISLDMLRDSGLLPTLIVTQPDKPQGRHLVLTPSPVKVWAEENNIPYLTPEKLNDKNFLEELKKIDASVYVLVSYGKLIPKEILDLPKLGILNLHPSLLPKLRGPSPIEGTILNDMKDDIGVTIMLLDEGMDEGPIVAQQKIEIDNWPPRKSILYEILAEKGGKLLSETLPLWVQGAIEKKEQDSSLATYSNMIEKKDGLLNLSDDAYQNFLKVRAYEDWPGTYFFIKHKDEDFRVKITDAEFIDGKLILKKVIPEGKREMSYEDFKRGHGINF